MPKTHFHFEASHRLTDVPAGGHIHIVGVCGVAMGQLALALSASGYRVSGSDKEFYPPMSNLLASSKVEVLPGYSSDHIKEDCDLVVIGNAISYGNPETDRVEELNLPYTSFAQLLYEFIIAGRHSIVVSGTHGKSTTTALCISALQSLKADPSYFVGGDVEQFDTGLFRGEGKVCVVEGDEYDTAFFAKVPKFQFYRPDTWIITSLEFDHADIYQNEDQIVDEFKRVRDQRPADTNLIVCSDYPRLIELTAGRKPYLYGRGAEASTRLLSTERSEKGQRVTFFDQIDECEHSFEISLLGEHNALNALAGYLALRCQSYSAQEAFSALLSFRGVRRRQEIRFQDDTCVLIEDFAHHPTAVRETLQGLRNHFPEGRLVAVFEPRSNTSRRKFFQKEYAEAFESSDLAIIRAVKARELDDPNELLDTKVLVQDIERVSGKAIELPNAAAIRDYILKERKDGDVIVVMSNGSFEGLIDQLLADLNG